jgi:hypothetical protein
MYNWLVQPYTETSTSESQVSRTARIFLYNHFILRGKYDNNIGETSLQNYKIIITSKILKKRVQRSEPLGPLAQRARDLNNDSRRGTTQCAMKIKLESKQSVEVLADTLEASLDGLHVRPMRSSE